MARKRASIRDKGREALGPTQQTSRGIDILFGELSEEDSSNVPETAPTEYAAATPEDDSRQHSQSNGMDEANLKNLPSQEREHMPVEKKENVAGVSAGPLPANAGQILPESLPVNEADAGLPDVVATDEIIDDLGLPVALEGPPADLIPAVPASGGAAVDGSAGSAYAAGTLSSAAAYAGVMPAAAGVTAGMATGSAASYGGPADVLATDEAADVHDLSGLADEDDLSGLMTDVDVGPAWAAMPQADLPPASFESDLKPEPVVATATPPPIASAPTAGTPTYAAGSTPAAFPTAKAPPAVAFPASKMPQASGSSPVSSAAAAAPSSPQPARPRIPYESQSQIESFSGIVTERIQVTPQNILPEDAQRREAARNVIAIEETEDNGTDAELAASIVRYVGRQRRENLDHEIEQLYYRVGDELSVNKKDTEFALNALRRAQDFVFEEPHQYDEALYLVATIRAMLARKRNIRHWSYTWGMGVFFYALAWLALFAVGFIRSDLIEMLFGVVLSESSDTLRAVAAAWYSGLAGGIGGGIGILYSLYWHVAFKQDFDPQYIMYYLVQPVMGFFLGFVVYFFVASGFLLVNFAINSEATTTGDVLASTTVIAIQVLLGFTAGFRQRFVLEMIDKVVQRVSPRMPEEEAEAKEPISVAPGDQADVTVNRPVVIETKKGQGGNTRIEIDRVENL